MSGAPCRIGFALSGAFLCGALLIGGCAHGPQPAVKDPAQGQYYTQEEMARLSPAERDRYCEAMETTLSGAKVQSKTMRARIDSLNAESDSLRNRSVRVSSQTRDLQTVLRDLRLKEKALNSYVVKPGDTLKSVARAVYGDSSRWKEIYDANKGLIGPENAPLKTGSRLTIPKKTEPLPGSGK